MPILSFDTFCQVLLRNAAPVYILTRGTDSNLLPTPFPIMDTIMFFHLYQSGGEKNNNIAFLTTEIDFHVCTAFVN